MKLSDEARVAVAHGDVIGAIRITRMESGASLAAAKAAVDAYMQGREELAPAAAQQIPVPAIASLQEGNFVLAIRQTREATGMGLKDSKEAVEAWLAANPLTREQFRAAAGRRGGGILQLSGLLVLVIAAALLVLKLLK